MAQAPPQFDQAQLGVLVRGAEKAFENAENLYEEAALLAKAGAIARALFLHQVSLEECSKVQTLGAWAIGLISGHEVNEKKVRAALARHESKNKMNAYMLEASKAEKDAKERGDWGVALEEFRELQVKFHEESNNAKNASLYVDWKDAEYVAPRERISVEMLTEIIGRNEEFLGHANNYLQMLRRLEKTPETTQGKIVEFMQLAEKMRAEKPDDLAAAMIELVSKFLDLKRDKEES